MRVFVALLALVMSATPALAQQAADLVLVNGKIVTVDRQFSVKQAVAVKGGKFLAVGGNEEIRKLAGPKTRVVDLKGRTVTPGLIDSHIHALRSGLTYDLELPWFDVRSIAEGLQRIREQAARTPAGTWIRVAGGWHESQFAEKRLPTKAELDAAAPNHPVWVQRLYDRVVLNAQGLKALGIGPGSQDPPKAKVARDANGNPTGVVAGGFFVVQGLLAKLPKQSPEQQVESTRHFLTELNRVGLTEIGDVAGGGFVWPKDHHAVDALHDRGQLTVRVRWYLQPNAPPGKDTEVIRQFIAKYKPGSGDEWMRPIGIGEAVTFAVFDSDSFGPHPPTFPKQGLAHWAELVRLIAQSGWRFQVHSTRDNSARQLLPAIEEVNRDIPLKDRRIAFAHMEDASVETIKRIKALGGGITVQDRMLYGGENVLKEAGPEVARRAPPLKTMLAHGLTVGGGTDSTRVSPYHPFWSIWWLITGKTVAGERIRGQEESLSREEALRAYTIGSAWFNLDEKNVGSIEPGKLADLIVLSDDYLTVPEDRIKELVSVLTIVGGKPVYAAGEFASLVKK